MRILPERPAIAGILASLEGKKQGGRRKETDQRRKTHDKMMGEMGGKEMVVQGVYAIL